MKSMFGIYELKYVNVYSHKVTYMYDITDKVYVWYL